MKRIESDIYSLLGKVPVANEALGAWRDSIKAYATAHPDG
jgi:hypothetical protein